MATTWLRARWGAWPVWEVLLLAAVTVVALGLRFHGYAEAPRLTDDADELNFAWGGLNLILIHDAYTWSYFPAYPTHTPLNAFGTTFPMVHHWLDHPPLFALLIGGWLRLLGVHDMLSVTAAQIRVLPVVFSTLTVPLVYLLGRRFVGRPASVCAAALLATSPAAVLLGRVTEAESLLAVVLLGALLLVVRVVDQPAPAGRWTVALLLSCCLVAPLLKVPGLAVGGICAVILAALGRWRLAGAVAGVTAAGLVLYVVYGAAVDWSLFTQVLADQSGRRTGMLSAFNFITSPAGVNRSLHDGWWLLGWIGLALLATRGRRRCDLFLIWPVAAYAATMLLLANESQVAQYGWYRVIVYPELYLAAGWLAWEAISRRSLGLATLLLALGGATATNWWLAGPTGGWVPNPLLLIVLAAVVLGPLVLAHSRRGDPAYRWAAMSSVGAALAFFIVGNTVESLELGRIYFGM